jgi:hypothetical protein
MKQAFRFCLAALLLWIVANAAAWAGSSQITGVWRANLHDLPCVKLTVHYNNGQLSGTIIFYPLMKENGAWRAGDGDIVDLIHPHMEGNIFVFAVKHPRKHNSATPDDQELKTFRMELIGEDKGVFRDAMEGQDLILLRTAA